MNRERLAVALAVSTAAGIIAWVGLRALSLHPWVAGLLAVVGGALGAIRLARRLPVGLEGSLSRRPALCALWMVLALLALVQTARLSAFMADPGRTQHSLMPWNDWLTQHSCLTAYTEAARLSDERKPNVYDPRIYSGRKIGGFRVDQFHYPPPFLLLPRALQAGLGGDYPPIRAAWFALSALTFMLAVGLVGARLEREGQLRLIFGAPAIWLCLPTQLALQMSNVQILVLSLAMIAMVVMQRSAVLGGGLLALTIVSKLFPGILLVYLAAQRRWREILWTTGFALALCGLAWLVLGETPFLAFASYELPRLSSGEAFTFPFSRLFAVARNMAPFGLPLKVDRLEAGSVGMTTAVAAASRLLSLAFGLAVVALAVRAGRARQPAPGEAAMYWIALLGLASLGSPFAPANYVLLAVMWLVFIHPKLGRGPTALAAWLLVSLPLLIPNDAAYVLQLVAFLPAQLLALALPAVVLWHAGRADVHSKVGR